VDKVAHRGFLKSGAVLNTAVWLARIVPELTRRMAGNKKAAGAAFNVAPQRHAGLCGTGLPPGMAGNKKGAEAPF